MANEIRFVHDDPTRIALIVTDEMKELYRGNDFVTVYFNVKDVSDLEYRVVGLGNAEGGYSLYTQDIWDATGGAEGSLIYNLSGDVVYPAKWKGYQCTLFVDSWINRPYIREKGYLGEGQVSDKKVSLHLYVNPHISKGIFEYISNRFKLLTFLFGPKKTLIVCRILNLHVMQYVQENGEIPPVKEEDGCSFNIVWLGLDHRGLVPIW